MMLDRPLAVWRLAPVSRPAQLALPCLPHRLCAVSGRVDPGRRTTNHSAERHAVIERLRFIRVVFPPADLATPRRWRHHFPRHRLVRLLARDEVDLGEGGGY